VAVDAPRNVGWGAAWHEIGAGVVRDGVLRRGREGEQTAHRDGCGQMRSRRTSAGGQRDESVAVASGENVRE
jgi:hypothetical protein